MMARGPLPAFPVRDAVNALGVSCVMDDLRMDDLRPFQKRFIKAAASPKFDTVCLSIPRGNGKSYLAGRLLTRALTPGDPLFRSGTESVLLSGSIEQCRIVFKFCRLALEATGEYRFLDSATRCGITHKATNTRVRVHGSNSKTAFGLVNVPFVVWDEPGAAGVVSGEQLLDAVITSQGKPGSPLKAVLIGTLAPSTGGWWHRLIADGSHHSTYTQVLQGDPHLWDQWREIRRCNPLTAISADFRRKLLEERDAARRDSRLKARFLSYRLNVPTGDESTMLLSVDDFEGMARREVPAREGRPIVGVDLGAGRAWSAAVAVWESGRIEALAVAPGIPDITVQEDRDQVPRGTYARLIETGRLRLAHGLRVQPPGALVEAINEEFGPPELIVCDRFRLGELQDCTHKTPVIPRVSRWSEAAFDIRALRQLAVDGPFTIAPDSRPLLAASLAVAVVKNDDAGNVRLAKKGTHNCSRDDVAAALVLGAGVFQRSRAQPKRGGAYLGLA